MPNRPTLIAIGAFCLVLVALGLKTAHSYSKVSVSKEVFLSGVSEPLRRTHKLASPINVRIINDNFTPATNHSHFVLRGEIATKKLFSSIQYEWILPPDVKWTSARPQSGELKNITPRENRILTGEFESLSDVNQTIYLRVWLVDGIGRMPQTVQYNTVEQNEIDATYKMLSEKNTEYIKAVLQ